MALTPDERKGLLRMKGLTMADVARDIGVTRAMVVQVCNDKWRSTRVERGVAEALGLPEVVVFAPRSGAVAKAS